MNDHWLLLGAFALAATVQTGGGGHIGGDSETGRDYVGRDQIIYADQHTWRTHIDQHLRDQRGEMMELRRAVNYQWLTIGIMTVIILFAFTISAGVVIRQFDQISLQIERQFDRIERQLEQRIP